MSVAFGPFVLDTDVRQVRQGQTALHLTPKAFELLVLLADARPRALSKQELQERLWPSTFVGETSLTTLINELRTAFGDRPREAQFIRTVHGFGYAFCAEATAGGPTCWLVVGDERVRLHPGENVVGRGTLVGAGLAAAGVSRRHARIVVVRGAATIEDLRSKNGTYAAGEPVTGVSPLRDGDQIRFGSAQATFRIVEDEGATETVVRSGAPVRPHEN